MNALIGDIGNTTTKICLINIKNFKIKKTIYLYSSRIISKNFLRKKLKKIINKKKIRKLGLFSSVVPKYQLMLKKFLKKVYKVNLREIKEKNINKIVKINIKNKKQIGSDRIANAISVMDKKNNFIIVDFGTATTFDVVRDDGAYIGGLIAPGVNLSLDALYRAAARLPSIAITKPDAVVGQGTVSAMQSGIFWGYIGLIEGLVSRIKMELDQEMTVIATGGLASLFSCGCEVIYGIDENLTIKGLQMVHEMKRESAK